MMLQKLFPIYLVSLFILTGCFLSGDRLAGNGSEVENGISGMVYLPDGSTVEGAVVTLYPVDYNPYTDSEADLRRDTTDVNGRYDIPTLPDEPYNIEARSPSRTLSALVSNPRADTLILSESGSILFNASDSLSYEAYIPGTGIRSASGARELLYVPTGIFPVLSRAGGTLATALPVGTSHSTAIPSHIIAADSDTYLESTEPDRNMGAKQFLRLKSGDQGFILLHFDLKAVSTPDSATLWLAVSEFQMDFVNYGYNASLYGFTAPWVEGTGYDPDDPADGSTYQESGPGVPWPGAGLASSLDSASRIDVSFTGVRGEQIKHPFPVSGAILQGLKDGTYTGIAIVENSAEYNNADFSSTEGYNAPELYLYGSN